MSNLSTVTNTECILVSIRTTQSLPDLLKSVKMPPAKLSRKNTGSELRVYYSNKILSGPLTCSQEAYNFFMQIWDKSLINIQEQVYILFLNNANQVIGWRCLNTGTISETLFDVRFALSCALGCMASKIIIAHNHPSHKLNPSYGDITVTDRLNKAADTMDIKLEDHLIVTRKAYYSFKDSRLIK